MKNKRTNPIERILALVLLIILFPGIVIIGLVIYLQIKESPVFIQKRSLSFAHSAFNVYKFRTLYMNRREAQQNIFYKKSLCRYLIPVGRFLRRTGLDEILQLINICKGEMKFIGPRPFAMNDLRQMQEKFPSYYEKKKRINEIPGITGFWQVFGSRSEGVENLIRCEQYYTDNKSLKMNLLIIIKTLLVILNAKHSDAILNNENYKHILYQEVSLC